MLYRIYKDRLRANKNQAENHHANPISWPKLRVSPAIYPPFPDICCAGWMAPYSAALIFHVCMYGSELWTPHCWQQMAAGSEVIAARVESVLSSDRLTWFLPSGSWKYLLRHLTHPWTLWQAVFAEGKWPVSAEGGRWLAVTRPMFDKWNDTKLLPSAANVFGLVGTSWLLIRPVYTSKRGKVCLYLCHQCLTVARLGSINHSGLIQRDNKSSNTEQRAFLQPPQFP